MQCCGDQGQNDVVTFSRKFIDDHMDDWFLPDECVECVGVMEYMYYEQECKEVYLDE